MKVNYHNEDYKSNIFSLAICIIAIIVVIIWGFSSNLFFDIGGLIFLSIFIIILLIPICILIRRYHKQKTQRNLNLFIIKNGVCINGKIKTLYDNKTIRYGTETRTLHNITAEIIYNVDNEEKVIVVDNLCINMNDIKKYENKTVKIYIYNNMNYIDLIN